MITPLPLSREAKVPELGLELTIELAKLFVKGNDSVKKFDDFHVIDENTELIWWNDSVLFPYNPIPESLGVVENI